jgi:tetratricopeptide (TPR) repeat protein
MKRNSFLYIVIVTAVLAIGACSQPSPPAKTASRPDHDPQAAVASIRAAGAQFDASVEVRPLRDPAVDGLLKQAHELEAQWQPVQALANVRKALTIAPNAPDILQYQAELLVETGDWKQAAASAQKSWELGPKVGSLCARNLEALAQARTTLGDVAGAAQARQQLTGCRVPPPVRL